MQGRTKGSAASRRAMVWLDENGVQCSRVLRTLGRRRAAPHPSVPWFGSTGTGCSAQECKGQREDNGWRRIQACHGLARRGRGAVLKGAKGNGKTKSGTASKRAMVWLDGDRVQCSRVLRAMGKRGVALHPSVPWFDSTGTKGPKGKKGKKGKKGTLGTPTLGSTFFGLRWSYRPIFEKSAAKGGHSLVFAHRSGEMHDPKRPLWESFWTTSVARQVSSFVILIFNAHILHPHAAPPRPTRTRTARRRPRSPIRTHAARRRPSHGPLHNYRHPLACPSSHSPSRPLRPRPCLPLALARTPSRSQQRRRCPAFILARRRCPALTRPRPCLHPAPVSPSPMPTPTHRPRSPAM